MLDERKSKENLRARFPADRKPYTSNYEYEDDSDLEVDDDDSDLDSDSEDEPAVVPQVATEKPADDTNVIVENLDAKSNGSSDIISVSDVDSLFSEPLDTRGEMDLASPAHVGKVVVIEDVAFVTWAAFPSSRCIIS